MKALRYSGSTSHGSHGMRWCDDAPLPTSLGNGQVRVQVRAAALNPVDYKLAKLVPSFLLGQRVVGQDFAGVVVESSSSKFPTGSKIYGMATGSLAEMLVADEADVAFKPDNLSFLEAATLPTVSLTGYQGLLQGGVSEGSNVLIVGASGGCGAIATQIARAMIGPRGKIGGVCSGANAEKVKAFGCDVVGDYRDPQSLLGAASALRGLNFRCCYDAVTSTDPGDGLDGKPYDVALREAGILSPECFVSALNGSASRWMVALLLPFLQGSNFKLTLTKRSGEQLEKISQWVKEGRLCPVIDSTFAFTPEGTMAAYDKQESRRAVGKIAIDVSLGTKSE